MRNQIKLFDVELYRKADPEVVDLVLTTAGLAGFQIAAQPEWTYWADRKLSDFSWNPRFKMQYYMERRPGFEFIFLAHHVMHFFSRAPVHQGGFAKTVLLGENFACNLDGYFAARLVQTYGASTTQRRFKHQYPFTMMTANARRCGVSYGRLLARLNSCDPFELYKELVGATHQRQLMFRAAGDAVLKPSKAGRTRKSFPPTSPLPYCLIANFDYELHNRFTDFNEGRVAGPRDRNCAKELAMNLRRSRTMPEFLRRLGASQR